MLGPNGRGRELTMVRTGGGPAAKRIGLQVEIDALRLLYRQARPAAAMSVLLGVLYTWLMWPRADPSMLAVWFALLLVAALVRAVLFLRWWHRRPSGVSILRWRRSFHWTAVAGAAVWGLGPVAVVPPEDIVAKALTAAMLVGLAGGAVATYAASHGLTVAVVILLLVPMIVALLRHGGDMEYGLATLMAAFLMGARSVRVHSSALAQAFRLRHELQHANVKAERSANTDALTGIANRRAFLQRAESLSDECRRLQQPVAVLIIDVDHFKAINDRFGHAAGDVVLREVALRIEAACRRSDFVGRIGGEEFAVLLPNTRIDEARHLAERIRGSVGHAPLNWDDYPVALTLSLGVAEGDGPLRDLMRRADAALYGAKAAGRDRVAVG